MNTTKTSFVYCIGAADADFVKIGISTDPYERLSKCQVGNPKELELLYTIPGAEREEEAIHWLFGHLHERGEWFADLDGVITRWFSERAQLLARLAGNPDKLRPVLHVGALGTAKASVAQARAKARGRTPGRKPTIHAHFPRIKELYDQGKSSGAIGLELGLSVTAMRKAFKELGLTTRMSRPLSETHGAEIAALRKQGFGERAVANKLGLGRHGVAKTLARIAQVQRCKGTISIFLAFPLAMRQHHVIVSTRNVHFARYCKREGLQMTDTHEETPEQEAKRTKVEENRLRRRAAKCGWKLIKRRDCYGSDVWHVCEGNRMLDNGTGLTAADVERWIEEERAERKEAA